MLAPFGLSNISHDFWMAGPTCVCDIIYHAGFISSGNLMTLVFLFLVMF